MRCFSVHVFPYKEKTCTGKQRTYLFLLQLQFKSNSHKILVTYLILDAEKHAAIRNPLHALLFELQDSVYKEGVAGHALNMDFQKFSGCFIYLIWL